MNAFDRLCQFLRASWPTERWRDLTVLVAVSGGADSLALLHALVEIKRHEGGRGQLILAHYNHGIRGKIADADQTFVRQAAEYLGLKYEIDCWQPACGKMLAEQTAPSDEATMRARRYAFLASTAHRVGARYVATGHTRDDNVETMLHHLFRGTGPAGLAGMPAHRELTSDVLLIRPLLSVDRQLLRDSLRAIGKPWREDDSNQDPRWKRNWIRHKLLPLIEQQYPAASQRIASALASQRKLVEMLDTLADQWIEFNCQIEVDDAVDGYASRVHIASGETPPLHDQSPVVIHAFRQLWDRLGWPRGAMREEHWQRLWQTLLADSPPPFSLPGKIRVSR
ncbi:MAG: tRNA lysidine(34) synthetase TilS, partial [Pirellulaceae bacterium]